MASKTSLPIARLRSLGCRVATGHYHNPVEADVHYVVTLPKGVDVRAGESRNGRAKASGRADGKVSITALHPGVDHSLAALRANEAQVAGLLNRIADVLSKVGA